MIIFPQLLPVDMRSVVWTGWSHPAMHILLFDIAQLVQSVREISVTGVYIHTWRIDQVFKEGVGQA